MVIDDISWAVKDTSPAGAGKITEIGWYCNNATPEVNFEVGIYGHNVGDDNPEAIVGVSRTNAKGTSSGWKRVTGLNIAISPNTIYWIAVQVDNLGTTTDSERSSASGERFDYKAGDGTLTDPWAVSDQGYDQKAAIYAVYESAGSTPKIDSPGVGKEWLGDNQAQGIY